MEIAGEFKYAVVQFLELPCSSIDDYICIPQSWIRERRVTDRKSLVAYPSESPSLIEKRVIKAEKVSKKWKTYMAIVKHETNSYEDANNYIMAKKHDSSTAKRCSRTIRTDHKLVPAMTTERNSSSLKRIKQSNNDRKRLKVVDDTRRLYSSSYPQCSNNELTSRPSTEASSEKLIEITEGKRSSTKKVSYQNVANNSFCNPSLENKSRCLPVSYNSNQQDLRTTGLLGGTPSNVSVITKSPSVTNNTAQCTLNSSNQPFQSFSHFIQQQNQVLPSHRDQLKCSHRQGVLEKPKETQVISPGTSSQSNGDTLHATLNPLILANQIFQGVHQLQGNQLSSTYQDHLQRIVRTHEIHRRNISNLQTLLPDFYTNQKCSQGSGQSTQYAVQNPRNVANQFSQTPNSSTVHKDHSQVQLSQETPVSQSTEVNCTNYIPSTYSGTMYVPCSSVSTSNSEGQSPFPTQHLDINQPPVDGNHSHQDPSLQEINVHESTEVSCIQQSVSSKQCTENESSANPNFQNQSTKCSMAKSPPVDKVTTEDVSQGVNDVNEQSSTEMSTEKGLTSQSPFEQGQSVDSITNIEAVWLDRMADLFDRMNSDFSQTCKMAHELHESLVQSAKTFECIASLSMNLRKLKKSNATVKKRKEVTVEDQKVAEKEQVEMEGKEKSRVDMTENKKGDNNEPKRVDDNDESSKVDNNTVEDDDKDEDEDEDKNKDKNKDEHDDRDKDKDKNKDENEDEEAQKKIRGCIRSFVLPPEYDPKDTKWTLKHRKPSSKLGLVELVEKSHVYINAIRLAHCKRVSKDSKTLARMLLVEVFSQGALSVCSLTGARANAFDIKGTNVRPGLDEHARMVILTFVEEEARRKGWGPFDTQSVINSIRSKIQEIRAKYGQTT